MLSLNNIIWMIEKIVISWCVSLNNILLSNILKMWFFDVWIADVNFSNTQHEVPFFQRGVFIYFFISEIFYQIFHSRCVRSVTFESPARTTDRVPNGVQAVSLKRHWSTTITRGDHKNHKDYIILTNQPPSTPPLAFKSALNSFDSFSLYSS